MDNNTPIRYRPSAILRAEVDRLVAKRNELRVAYVEADGMQAKANIACSGAKCNENVKRIRAELERRRSYMAAQAPSSTFEPEYGGTRMDTTWEDLHLAVGTWS